MPTTTWLSPFTLMRSADQSRVGTIPSAPQRIADHDHSFIPRLFLLGGKPTAVRYRNTQKGEEVGRDARAAKPFRLAIAGQIAFPGPQGAHRREGRICFAPLEVGLDRHRQARELAAALRYHHLDAVDLVRLGIRKRLQQDGIDDAEDRRVRADPERERDDRSRRKSGLLPQASDRRNESLARSDRAIRQAFGRDTRLSPVPAARTRGERATPPPLGLGPG